MQETVLADEDAYDQVFLHCIQGVAASVSGGYLYNIDTLRYIDTDAEWWNRAQMDNLKLGEGTYYIVNDMMIPCPYVIYFNKGMISELDLDDPYQLVFNKKWTLEKFADMIKEATTDSDGDGQMTPADRYGLSAGDDSNYISFVPGCGQYITERDEEGKITLSINTPKMQDLMEKFVDYTTKNYILFQPSGQTENRLTLDSGRILFFISGLTDAEGMRDYTVDFGFLPFPMYDEKQEDYMSLDWGGLSGVPASIKNPDMVGAVLELYAYESKNEVIPTYYDKVLEGKLSRDENSVKMIDLLFDTIVYEIGGNYFGFEQGFNALFYALPNVAIRNRNPVFSSLYSSSEMPSKTVISNFYKALDTQEHAEE